MNEQDNGKKPQGSVEEILKERLRLEEERRKLDQMLKERYQRQVAVMFTDIKGSTQFFETYGDIEGRALIEKHNKILFPLIEKYQGKIIKTIGDAIMAMFEDPEKSVLCAIEMQKALAEYNHSQDERHKEIHIRIGLNWGLGVVEENDVFGDVVNVSARVESQCEPDQILISESLYQTVRKSEDILCRFFGEVEVKGKSEPLKLYRVIWSEEQLISEEEFKKAGVRRARAREKELLILELNITREREQLKVSVGEHKKGEERTVQQYQTVKISEEAITQLCSQIRSLLNQANRRGRLSKEILKQLQQAGQSLYDQLLSREAKEKLEQSQAGHLVLRIDDQLVQIPWELLYDGKEFLCLRFNMGRIVSTRQRVREGKARKIAHPLRMLVLADPRGDLPQSAREGILLRDELDRYSDLITVNLKSSRIDRNYILSRIRDYDIVHYAGHADYDTQSPEDSGWLLADGKLKAVEIKNLSGRKPMPALVFANGCQSGQTEAWSIEENYEERIFGLANAFLVSGVQHYIGTFWEILDEPGREFALAFYQELLAGATIGEAVKEARKHLINKYGEETIVWASYMLYGDPSYSYLVLAKEEEKEEPEETKELASAFAETALRGSTAEALAVKKFPASRWVYLGILFALLIAGGLWLFRSGIQVKIPEDEIELAYQQLRQGNLASAQEKFTKFAEKRGLVQARGLEGLSAVFFQKNDLAQAKDYALKALEIDAEAIYPHIILGNIFYNQGDIASAEQEYRQAIAGTSGRNWMKAEAYNRLGRIYSEKGRDQLALESYQQAVSQDPANIQASVNLGQKYLALGKSEQAKATFQKVLKASPDNQMVSLLLAEAVRRSQEAVLEKERADQLNQEINQLIERYKAGKLEGEQGPQDTWTSRPITLAFIDFETKGKFGLMEGEDDFLRLAITNALKETGRVRVVEREKLDRIIQELNLSSSELASDETRLKLGRLLSARLIASGSIIRYGGKLQISLRLIETETSEVKVAITTDTFPEDAPPEQVANELVSELVKKLRSAYPLRGEIIQVEGEELVINLGSKIGAKPGIQMRILKEKQVKIGERLTTTRLEVGKAEIERVEDELSYARPVEAKEQITTGMKVEEIVE